MKISPTLIWVACMAGGAVSAAPLFPDIAHNPAPRIRSLPQNGEIVLEIRSGVLSGDPVTEDGTARQGFQRDVNAEIGVLNLSSRSESVWQLADGVHLRFELTCNECTMRASWAPKTQQLFIALSDGPYLVNTIGEVSAVRLKMPGVSLRYSDEADNFAISDDAQLLAFRIDGRDQGDRHSEVYVPHTDTLGRYYQGIVTEGMGEPTPVISYPGNIQVDQKNRIFTIRADVPAWSPGRKSMAYSWSGTDPRGRQISGLIIAPVDKPTSPPVTVTVPPPWSNIFNIRWSADGSQIAFIAQDTTDVINYRTRLFATGAHGEGLHAVRFGNKDIYITAFAWAPSGDRIIFRSDYQAKPLCNSNPVFRMQAGQDPCRRAEYLYTAKSDGSALERPFEQPEYRHAQLFWIR
jgi:hypothetical protein